MRIIIIGFIFLLISCRNESKIKNVKHLTTNEKKVLKDFAYKFTSSVNNYEYDLVRNSWDNEIFRKRVTKLTKTEQTVFNYYFKKEFAKKIFNVNIDLINKLKFNNGHIFLSKIIYYPRHADIILTFVFNGNIDFWKYRIELKNSIPKLTDYYSYKDEFWQSQNMKNIIRLNSKYTAISKERQLTNRNLMESDRYLRNGDSLSALELLYNIPETYLIGNALSLKRINLAYAIHDTIFVSALMTEKELNKSIYISYLYGYYFHDTIELNNVFEKLDKELGVKNNIIDSLKTLNYFWN